MLRNKECYSTQDGENTDKNTKMVLVHDENIGNIVWTQRQSGFRNTRKLKTTNTQVRESEGVDLT